MIELHESYEKPKRYKEDSNLSVSVYGIDEYGTPMALYYIYWGNTWSGINGEIIDPDNVNFKWFYIPEEVKW